MCKRYANLCGIPDPTQPIAYNGIPSSHGNGNPCHTTATEKAPDVAGVYVIILLTLVAIAVRNKSKK